MSSTRLDSFASSISSKDILEQKKLVLEQVQGKDLQGNDQFAYVLLKKTNLQKFKQALASDNVRLADHGVVIATGIGTHPPADLEDKVMDYILKK